MLEHELSEMASGALSLSFWGDIWRRQIRQRLPLAFWGSGLNQK